MRIGKSNSNIWQLWSGSSIEEGKGASVQEAYLKSNFCLSDDTASCFLIMCQCVVSAQELSMIWKECCEFCQIWVEVSLRVGRVKVADEAGTWLSLEMSDLWFCWTSGSKMLNTSICYIFWVSSRLCQLTLDFHCKSFWQWTSLWEKQYWGEVNRGRL